MYIFLFILIYIHIKISKNIFSVLRTKFQVRAATTWEICSDHEEIAGGMVWGMEIFGN